MTDDDARRDSDTSPPPPGDAPSGPPGAYAPPSGYAAPDGYAPPGGYAAPDGYAPPGGYAAPGGYAQPSGSGSSDPYSQASWTPPPKPGLIPLRPLSFGTILAAPYQLLRRNPRPTFGLSLLVQSVVAIITVGVVGGVSVAAISRVEAAASSADADTILAGSVAAVALSALIPVALSIIAAGVLQGIIVLEASRQAVGEKLRFPQLWARAKGRVFVVAGYTALLTLGILLAVAIIVGIAIGLSTLGTGGIVAAVMASIILGLGLIVLLAWISTKLAFVPSVIMLERATLGGAVRRSWQLTGGSFWRLFGTILLVAVMLNIATTVITFPVQLLSSIIPAILAATGDETVIIASTVVVNLVYVLVAVAVGAVALIIQSATTALLYIDQRMRREGLDLALTEYVDARQAGRTDVDDPYAPNPGHNPSTTAQESDVPAAPGDSPWA